MALLEGVEMKYVVSLSYGKTKKGARHRVKRFSKLQRRMFRGMAMATQRHRLELHMSEKWWAEAQKRKDSAIK